MIQKGDLKRISCHRLLQWIGSTGKDGTLKVTRGSELKVILVKSGQVLAAFSDNPKEKLWMICLKTGLLDEFQLSQIQSLQKQSAASGSFETLLIEHGFLQEQDLAVVRQLQAQEIILSIYDWTEGEFYYYPDQYPEYEDKKLRLSLQDVLQQGLKRLQRWKQIHGLIKPEDQIRLNPAQAPERALARPLLPLERRLVEMLKTPAVLKDIVARSPYSEFDTLAVIADLVAANAVVTRSASQPDLVDLRNQALAFRQEGKHWEAFKTIKELLKRDPNNFEHQLLLKEFTRTLGEDLKEKLGNINAVPKIVKELDPETWGILGFDAGDGFIISRIDGRSSIKDLFNVVKMDSKKILTTFYRLIGAGIIEITDPSVEQAKAKASLQEIMTIHRSLAEKSYYEVLGLEATADDLQIKKAYLDAVRKYHPDTLPSEGMPALREWYEKVFTSVQEAYETLSDLGRRRTYDKNLGIQRSSAQSEEQERILNRARTQFRIGLQSFKSRDYARAIEYIQSAIDLNPDEAMYYAKLAEVCMKNPRWYHSGKTVCAKAVQLDPENPNYYCLMGLLLKLEGNLIDAEAQFRNALQIDPSNSMARREMLALGHKLKELPKRQMISDITGNELVPRPKTKGR